MLFRIYVEKEQNKFNPFILWDNPFGRGMESIHWISLKSDSEKLKKIIKVKTKQ